MNVSLVLMMTFLEAMVVWLDWHKKHLD